jgi:hypothetical protein
MNNNQNFGGAMMELKRVAFVAMPFGTKGTDIQDGEGPDHVDFDALWEKAYYPALVDLQYLPVRADNQTGSVIIKDMLEQLVHADLVLADITIPNGNVYYEAGVRHAARENGCVLLCTEWAKLLFDLEQITQLRYPYPKRAPTDEDYRKISGVLKKDIPPLVDAAGPIYELVRGDPEAPQSRHLKEVSAPVFEFQTKLAAARLAAAANQKDDLRSLNRPEIVKQLPVYALRELTVAVREHLSWGELSELIEWLPDSALKDPYFQEHQALALAKQGRYYDAVGLLQTVNDTHGPTPIRCWTLGKRYLDLAREERRKSKKRQYIGRAVEAFRRGVALDLNGFLCARKLLVTLVERGREDDFEEIRCCAALARYAVERANPEAEWVLSTFAVLAFYNQDEKAARHRIDDILDRGATNAKLVALVQDLEALMGGIDEVRREPFQEMLETLKESLPVAQEKLMSQVLPIIRNAKKRYRKFQQVHARPAKAGEVIVSKPSDGEETTKTAAPGDVVVKNLTEAKELYLVGEDKFNARYTHVKDLSDGWRLYDPVGEVLCIEISSELTAMLGVGEVFFIGAPWGSEQLALEGDMFVSPLPTLDEVYRVARKEFDETYKSTFQG